MRKTPKGKILEHLLLIYRLITYTSGVIILILILQRYFSGKNPYLKNFLILWVTMTLTSISYLVDYYMNINSNSDIRFFTYRIMLLSILTISAALPNFVHTVFNVNIRKVKWIIALYHILLSLALLLTFDRYINIPAVIMCTIVISTLYSYTTSFFYIYKLEKSIERTHGIRFLLFFLPFFILLYFIDIRTVDYGGFHFFPIFYNFIGICFYRLGIKKIEPGNINSCNSQEGIKEPFNLTKRELEIALLLIEGMKYKDIASKLNVSLHTINTHVMNIYRKTETNSKIQLQQKLNAK